MPIIDDYNNNQNGDLEGNDIITPSIITVDITNSKIKVFSDTFGYDVYQTILFEYNLQLFKITFHVHVNGNKITIEQKSKNASEWTLFMDYIETPYRPTGLRYVDAPKKHYKEGSIWKDYAIGLVTNTFKH